MRFNLGAMLRRNSNRRRPGVLLRPISLGAGLEADLAAILARIPAAWARLAASHIMPALRRPGDRLADAAMRDDSRDIEEAFGAADAEIERLALVIGADLRRWTVRAETVHRKKWAASILHAGGIDLTTLLGPDAATMGAFNQSILGLVRSINSDTRSRIGQAVWQGFTARTDHRAIARQIAETTAIQRRRALRIANDQTTKMAGRLDQARQEEAGISRYRWRHSGKLHPRPEHVARDGKLFAWDNPPPGGHPGTEINCGCKAQAYIDLMEDD